MEADPRSMQATLVGQSSRSRRWRWLIVFLVGLEVVSALRVLYTKMEATMRKTNMYTMIVAIEAALVGR